MSEVLLTGFQPYGGRLLNPAAEVVATLDGAKIGQGTVRGLLLPVSITSCGRSLEDAIERYRPVVVVSLGLWPGEATVRFERVAVNHASFEVPDNDGVRLLDDPVDAQGPVARAATLPVSAIVTALREKGIPARVSYTAGTFLCNTTLYRALGACDRQGIARCGFVHLPYLPGQVVDLLDELAEKGQLELHQRADLASMSLDMMFEAVRTTIAMSLERHRGRSDHV